MMNMRGMFFFFNYVQIAQTNDFRHFLKQLPTTFLRLKAFSHEADSKEEEEEDEEWHATKTQSGV